jgi:DNA-binding response OmpR family regulator
LTGSLIDGSTGVLSQQTRDNLDLLMLYIEVAKTDGFEFMLGIRKLYAINELPIILLGDTNQTLDMAQGLSTSFFAIP